MNRLLNFIVMNKAGIIFLLLSLPAKAQKNMDGLIRAEKNFAAHSVAHNTKDAFLKFLDSTGIVFEQGQPVNGMEAWNKKEKSPGILNWHPQFAEIAGSNDFGYTTGPWTFQPQTPADSVVARGLYTTVWHLDADGDWKFLVDLGVSNLPATDSSEVHILTVEKFPTGSADSAALLNTEEKFITAFQKNKADAYRDYLSRQSILNRNRSLPAAAAPEQTGLIEATPQELNFTMKGFRMARSGDLGCVYGTTLLGNTTENYLRIWRREKQGWKIAVEVLRF